MNCPNCRILPYIIKVICDESDQSIKIENVILKVKKILQFEKNNRFKNLNICVEEALEMGQDLGLLACKNGWVRLCVSLRHNGRGLFEKSNLEMEKPEPSKVMNNQAHLSVRLLKFKPPSLSIPWATKKKPLRRAVQPSKQAVQAGKHHIVLNQKRGTKHIKNLHTQKLAGATLRRR